GGAGSDILFQSRQWRCSMSDDLWKHLMNHSPNDEWSNWDRSQALPESHSHWTRGGTATIKPEIKLGSLWAVLEFNGQVLNSFRNADEAAKAIAGGEFDSKLPEPASALGIPTAVHQ